MALTFGFYVFGKELHNGVLRAYFREIHDCGFDKGVVDFCAVLKLWYVAWGFRKDLEYWLSRSKSKSSAGKLHGSSRIHHDLNGFDSGDFVKEPSATRENEQSHDAASPRSLITRRFSSSLTPVWLLLPSKLFMLSCDRSQYDGYVVVSCVPRVFEVLGGVPSRSMATRCL